jgi:hypothetical protein
VLWLTCFSIDSEDVGKEFESQIGQIVERALKLPEKQALLLLRLLVVHNSLQGRFTNAACFGLASIHLPLS